MQTHINDRMNRWADWRLSKRFGGVQGYPRQCGFMRMVPSAQAVSVFAPDLDEECYETEKAFSALVAEHVQMAQILFLFHCRGYGLTVGQIAKECGCSRDTLYCRVEKAHALVLGYLNDLAAGVALPVPSQKVAA